MATAAMNEAYQSVYRTMSTRPTREVIEAAQNLAVQNGWTTQAQRVATTTAAAAANNPRPSARVHPASVERERPHCPAGTGATLEDGQCCTHPQSIEHADGSVTILQAQCFPPSQ